MNKPFQNLTRMAPRSREGEIRVPVLRTFEYLPDPREQYRDASAEVETLVLETI